MDEKMIKKQTLSVCNREKLNLDGVINVEGFDESYVSLSTVGGRVVVEGSALKIEELTKDDGAILISGKIDGVFYTDEKIRTGILSKIFK